MNLKPKDPNDPFPKEEKASLTHSLLVTAILALGCWLGLLLAWRLLIGF